MIWTKTLFEFSVARRRNSERLRVKNNKVCLKVECTVLNSTFFLWAGFSSRINIRAACAAKPTPSKLRRTLTFHSPTGHTSSHKQVKTPTHTCVKVCLNREYVYPADNRHKPMSGRSNQQPRKDCTLQPIDYCTLIISVLVISERTNWLLVGGTKLYFPWNKICRVYIMFMCPSQSILWHRVVILQSTTIGNASNRLSLPPGFTHMNINLMLPRLKFYTLHWRFNTDSDTDTIALKYLQSINYSRCRIVFVLSVISSCTKKIACDNIPWCC